jgi:hypothetical protein
MNKQRISSYTKSALKIRVLQCKREGRNVNAERIVNDTLLICQRDSYLAAVEFVRNIA